MAFTRPKASQIDFDLTNITDPIIRLNSGETGQAGKDTGIVLERGDDTNVAILFDESANEFVLVNTNEGGNTSGNVTISSYADLQVATINTATLEIGGTAVSSTAAELNTLDGVTATTAELNILDGVTATTAELNYVDGVTSNIQTQLDAKAPTAGPTFTGTLTYATLNDGTTALTSTVAELNVLDGITATTTELNYADGVTSAIQTQLDSKLALAGGTMSGAIAMGTNKITGMGDPTANQDAATKAYVDTQTSSIVTTTDIAGDTGTDTLTLGSDTLTFSGTVNEIATAVTDNTVTISLPDDVTIGSDLTVTGNLTVNGTTTTISTTNSVVSDSLIELNTGAASNANDLGFIFERGSTGDNAAIIWDESADKFVVGTTTATGANTGDLSLSTGTLVANIEGNVTGNITGDVTGNADTATSLATARNIAGNSFDGTGDITIASTDLSDTASIVLTTASQTLTNKTLTSPIISSISNTGTLTLPTSTGTVALTSDITLSTLSVTSTAAELNILDGVTATTAELNILDGVTSTASELNIIDGDTSATSTTLADSDRVVVNDAGTMKQVALTDFETYFETALDTLSNVTSVGTLNGITIASTQTIDMGSNRVTQVADPVGDQDAATKAYVDANAGSGGGTSGFTASTFTTAPGADGDFDLSYNVAQTVQETPFEEGGSDAFGVALGEVYDMMEPVGSTSVNDMGVFT